MDPLFLMVILLMICSSIIITFVLLSDPEKAKARRDLKKEERKTANQPAFAGMHEYVSKAVEKRQSEQKKSFFVTDEQLELAKISLNPAAVIIYTAVGSIIVFVGITTLTNFFVGVMAALLVWWGVRFNIRKKVKKLQREFERQLGQALRVIASSLVSGQSLQGSFISVATDAKEPMAGEMTRVVNETRIGKDLILALEECARRMNSEDFEWFASAAELQRATGGNLVEIIETVAETIRERAELREKVRAYSSEGRASVYVLMGLPVILSGVFNILTPGYFGPMWATLIGKAMLIGSVILFGVTYVWMKKLIEIKI